MEVVLFSEAQAALYESCWNALEIFMSCFREYGCLSISQGLHPWIQPTIGQKYLKKNCICSDHVQTFLVIIPYCIQQLCNPCIGLGVSNIGMLSSMWQDVLRLYANIMPFYIRDLSICGFWYPCWGGGVCPEISPLRVPRDNSTMLKCSLATATLKRS